MSFPEMTKGNIKGYYLDIYRLIGKKLEKEIENNNPSVASIMEKFYSLATRQYRNIDLPHTTNNPA